MGFTNILNIGIVILFVLLIVYYIFFTKKESYEFYQVEDENGSKGIIHNRNSRYSKYFFVLKDEAKQGDDVGKLGKPKKIYVGNDIKNLFEKKILNIEEYDLYYKVEV